MRMRVVDYMQRVCGHVHAMQCMLWCIIAWWGGWEKWGDEEWGGEWEEWWCDNVVSYSSPPPPPPPSPPLQWQWALIEQPLPMWIQSKHMWQNQYMQLYRKTGSGVFSLYATPVLSSFYRPSFSRSSVLWVHTLFSLVYIFIVILFMIHYSLRLGRLKELYVSVGHSCMCMWVWGKGCMWVWGTAVLVCECGAQLYVYVSVGHSFWQLNLDKYSLK